MLKLLLTTVALAVACGTTWAETPEDLYRQLREEIRTEYKAPKDPNASDPQRNLRLENLLLETFHSDSLPTGNQKFLLNALTTIQALSKSPKIEKLVTDLREAVKTSEAKKDAEFAEVAATTMRQNAELFLKATRAADLDAPLQSIQKLVKQGEGEDIFRWKGGELERARALMSAIITMQDVFLAASAGNSNRNDYAEGNLQAFAGNLGDLLPRSAVMEKFRSIRQSAQGPKKPTVQDAEARSRELVREIRQLEDLAPTIQKMETLYREAREAGSSGSGNEGRLLNSLRGYLKAYEEVKAGFAVNLSQTESRFNNQGGDENFAAIRGMLARYALPQILQVTDPKAQPVQGENAAAYLIRLLNLAKSNRDWDLLARIMEAAQAYNITILASSTDLSAIHFLLAGVNQERARQFSGAVASYQSALKTGSQVIPAEWIGDKLDSIRSKSPSGYESGINEGSLQRSIPRTTPSPPPLRRLIPAPASENPRPTTPPQTPPASTEDTPPPKTAPKP